MKKCNACNAKIATKDHLCPLCRGPLIQHGNEKQYNAYPEIKSENYSIIKRALIVATILSVIGCAIINFFVTGGFWWWLLAAAGAIYAWAAVPHAMRRGGNAGGIILMQVTCACAFVAFVDFITGWVGWSVTVIMPGIFCAGIIAVVVLVVCNRTNLAGYVLYQAVLTACGFIPIVLYFIGYSQNILLAVLPTIMAIISLIMMFLFGDKTIKNEFKRRFRF